MKSNKILKWIIFSIATAINVFIIVNSFINGDVSTAESSLVIETTANIINGVKPGSINSDLESFVVFVRKVFGHFALFGLSGIITTWAFYLFAKGTKFNYFLHFGMLSLVAGFGIGFLSETIQIFVPGRAGSASDVMIDTLGYFIGDLLAIFVFFLAKKPIFSKVDSEEKASQ